MDVAGSTGQTEVVGEALVLAQFNVARLREALDHPTGGEFVAGIEQMNRIADRSPGFVWRHHQGHDGDPQLADHDDRVVVNLSTWR